MTSAVATIELQKPVLHGQVEVISAAQDGMGKLRNLIRLLAISGKLVEQHASDEPATACISRIEHDRLRERPGAARVAQLRPRTAGESTGEPELPRGWAWARISEIAQSRLGKMLDQAKNRGRLQPYLRNVNVQWGRIDVDDIKLIRLENSELDEYRLLPGDLLICEGGEPGRCAVWTDVSSDMYFQKALHRVRPEGGVSPWYLAICLEADARSGRLTSYMTGATIKHFAGRQLDRYSVPLPPIAEQARIVARVDELMRLCDALEAKGRLEAEQHARLLGTLLGTLTDSTTPEELAANWQRVATHFDLLLDRPEAVDALEQTILQLAVRGLLAGQSRSDASSESDSNSPSREEIDAPFAIPEDWSWARFSQVAQIASNLVAPQANLNEWQVAPDCIEKRTGRLLMRRTVRQAGVTSANHRFFPGQILYSKIRPSLSKAVLVDFGGLCSADMYPVSARIDASYLLLYMLSEHFLDQVAVAENRVKMPKLNQEALNSLLIAVPPAAEQIRIVTRVTELRRLCADLRQHLAAQQTVQSRLADALVDQALA